MVSVCMRARPIVLDSRTEDKHEVRRAVTDMDRRTGRQNISVCLLVDESSHETDWTGAVVAITLAVITAIAISVITIAVMRKKMNLCICGMKSYSKSI